MTYIIDRRYFIASRFFSMARRVIRLMANNTNKFEETWLPKYVKVRLKCGISFKVDLNENFWQKVASRGYHEEDTEKFLISVLKPGDIFVDIGAHLGIYSVIPSLLVNNEGHVYSFEPDPNNFQSLNKTISINNLKNITPSRMALGEHDKNAIKFHRPKEMWGAFQVLKDDIVDEFEKFSIKVSTLDTFLRSKGIHRVNAIKIDIDGPELMVLKGAQELLRSPSPPVLAVEVSKWNEKWGYGYKEVHDFLTSFGYNIYASKRMHLDVRAIHCAKDFPFDISESAVNLFCLIPEKHDKLIQKLWFCHPQTRSNDI